MKRLLLTLALLAFVPVAFAPAEDKASDKTQDSVSATLTPFVESKTLAGAVVLVANKDKVLCLEAVGRADIANNKPMKADSVFWIASMTKPITATGLMILVDEGKVKLDDPVAKYLPEFADSWVAAYQDKDTVLLKRPKKAMTVRHVLTHTSGLPFASKMEKPALEVLSLKDASASYAMTPLLSEPGTKWSYSNAGINVAGRIIEVVSKVPYEKFMQEKLFDPLGMKDTTFWPDEKQLARLAKSYKPNKEKDGLEETTMAWAMTYPLSDRKRHPMAAGGLFSTASDLGSFCRMILNGGELDGKKYLSAKAVKDMTTSQTGELPVSFGLGWAAGKKEGDPYGHGGAYATDMKVYPKQGLIVVYLVQQSGGYPGKDGPKVLPTVTKAAVEKYGEK